MVDDLKHQSKVSPLCSIDSKLGSTKKLVEQERIDEEKNNNNNNGQDALHCGDRGEPRISFTHMVQFIHKSEHDDELGGEDSKEENDENVKDDPPPVERRMSKFLTNPELLNLYDGKLSFSKQIKNQLYLTVVSVFLQGFIVTPLYMIFMMFRSNLELQISGLSSITEFDNYGTEISCTQWVNRYRGVEMVIPSAISNFCVILLMYFFNIEINKAKAFKCMQIMFFTYFVGWITSFYVILTYFDGYFGPFAPFSGAVSMYFDQVLIALFLKRGKKTPKKVFQILVLKIAQPLYATLLFTVPTIFVYIARGMRDIYGEIVLSGFIFPVVAFIIRYKLTKVVRPGRKLTEKLLLLTLLCFEMSLNLPQFTLVFLQTEFKSFLATLCLSFCGELFGVYFVFKTVLNKKLQRAAMSHNSKQTSKRSVSILVSKKINKISNFFELKLSAEEFGEKNVLLVSGMTLFTLKYFKGINMSWEEIVLRTVTGLFMETIVDMAKVRIALNFGVGCEKLHQKRLGWDLRLFMVVTCLSMSSNFFLLWYIPCYVLGND